MGTELEAREWERKLRLEGRPAWAGEIYPQIAEVIPDFMTSYKLDHQPQGYARMVRSIKHLLPFFGKLQFPALNLQVVEMYKTARLATITTRTGGPVSPSTVQKELCALSSLCKWAEERGFCRAIKIKKFPAKLTRAPLPRIPAKAEVLRVLDAIPQAKRGPFLAMYYGGLRKSEACGLRAEQVNIEAGLMIVLGKGNKERIVPLIDPLRTVVLERVQEVGSGLLWPNSTGKEFGDLRLILKWACRRAGVERLYTPHLLRHAFATHGMAAGLSLRGLQGIMGHSASTTTERYTHLAAEFLRAEMDKLEKA